MRSFKDVPRHSGFWFRSGLVQYLYLVKFLWSSIDSAYLNVLMDRCGPLIEKVNIVYHCRLILISSIERFLAGLLR